jgi:ribosomal 50S subunit-recycling heat shock protein
VLDIQFGQRTLTVQVERLTESNRKEDIVGLYTVLKEEARKREEDPNGL